jgi:hypothetical protein
MAYFYFDFRNIAQQGVRGLLTSLLTQLSAKSGRCSRILSELYSKYRSGSGQPRDDQLKQCLVDMLRFPEGYMTYIIVDALDECPNTSGVESRRHVLKLVEELHRLSLSNLRICLTSRPEADIIPTLEPLASQTVCLHDEVGQKGAISDYVKSIVYSDQMMKKWRMEDQELVIDTLVRKSDGM